MSSIELKKATSLTDLLNDCPNNKVIGESLIKAWTKINDPKYKKIFCSISGGADSDVMLDMCWRVDKDNKIEYVFFDTGIEYQATKDHLTYLEQKYNITIQRRKATVPVAAGCRKYGYPFLNKDLSAKIYSLQHNKFDFAGDGWKSYEELAIKYPKCKSALKWWCNKKDSFNIQDTPFLKEFMIENPPTFNISHRCCEGSKKHPSKLYEKESGIDLKCLGLRRAEGGLRVTSIRSCFSDNTSSDADKPKTYDDFRPIYYFTDKDKREYEEFYGITNSRCYTEYGFKRTGCCGCPYNSKFEDDLAQVEQYEPKLYKAIINIFKEPYEYTRKYREFRKKKKEAIQ